MASRHLQHCLDTVRRSDWEHYVTSLFIPAHARAAVFAVRAFNCEVASVRDSVSSQSKETIVASMRFQFWRDLVDGVYAGRPVNHPIALALADAVETTPISKHFLQRIISSREADFNAKSVYPTLASLEAYAEQSQSSLLYLQLEACGVQNFKVDHIASHIGKAIGISTILRGTPAHVQVRQLYLPSDLLAQHHVSTEEIFRKGPSEPLSDVVFDVASVANDHVTTARSHIAESAAKNEFPQIALTALLPAIGCDSYLQRLEKAQFDVFNPSLQSRDWKLLYQLWKKNRSGNI
ncbi:isoprenoid synthase domain-containing protein [Chytriomyces cf. hyalinus JEL632]|nr:isoprenoid synthase domain-containing protein [Chytriomyces cf. hyalinus JEL632]